jgi:hypothetical protein
MEMHVRFQIIINKINNIYIANAIYMQILAQLLPRNFHFMGVFGAALRVLSRRLPVIQPVFSPSACQKSTPASL